MVLPLTTFRFLTKMVKKYKIILIFLKIYRPIWSKKCAFLKSNFVLDRIVRKCYLYPSPDPFLLFLFSFSFLSLILAPFTLFAHLFIPRRRCRIARRYISLFPFLPLRLISVKANSPSNPSFFLFQVVFISFPAT